MERTPPTNIDEARKRRVTPKYVYECRCSGQIFYLHDDGRIECAACGLFHERLVWAEPGALNP